MIKNKLRRKVKHTKWFKEYTLNQINASQQRYISEYPTLKGVIDIFYQELKEIKTDF